MPKPTMTLKQLAGILNVSVSTISKALNDSPEISDATRARVKEVAHFYNYQPNRIAQNLKSGKTNIIALIIPSLQNFFFNDVLNGIEEALRETQYHLMINLTNESSAKEAQLVETLSHGLVDGLIIAMAEETQKQQAFDHFSPSKPIVFFDRIEENLNDFVNIKTNDAIAVENAVEYLMDKGRSTFALISTIHNLNVGKERKAGFVKAHNTHEKAIAHDLILESTKENVSAQTLALLKENKVDGIIALDEESSIAAVQACKTLGIERNRDIDVIGYASQKLAENMTPQLSTIDQHGDRIGKESVQILLDILQLKDYDLTHIKSELVIR
ncbi:LacI family DNA-binding transcriptional regulator [Gangjinia marincola]|uniref:LacI family DNA-binding transcriptional regulator n=1 Tax=Gangjinia marincola TaxID=578463 RepID=A0ABP3XV33_9FLAO